MHSDFLRVFLIPCCVGAFVALLSAGALPWIPVLRTMALASMITTVLLTRNTRVLSAPLVFFATAVIAAALLQGTSSLATIALVVIFRTILSPVFRVIGGQPSIRVAFIIGLLTALVEMLPVALTVHAASSVITIIGSMGVAIAWSIGAGAVALRVRGVVALPSPLGYDA